jgi:NAD+ kinase
MNKVGCCYHPKLPEEFGPRVARDLCAVAEAHGCETWLASAWDREATRAQMPGTDLLLSVGGDGTVLRAAQAVVPHPTLLLGVNMGRLGFLTELDAREAAGRLPDVLAGAGRVEERSMLHAEIVPAPGHDGGRHPARHDALNDIVIGRQTLGRTVQVSVRVDGALLADYRVDGVIVATATGSTAYSLSAGGPVLPPESREMLLTPLSPHLASGNSTVLPPASVIEIELAAGQQAALSVDGERDIDLAAGDVVRVALGPHRVRFLRLGPPARFYERLARRFNWLVPGEGGPAVDRAALREGATA